MRGALRSELRKMLTIRSTYVITCIALTLNTLFALYITSYKANPSDALKKTVLADEATLAVSLFSILIALIGVLLVTHEYRYNTIMYTLTASKSRVRIFLAKTAAISLYAIVLSALIGFMAAGLAKLGFHLQGHDVVAQQFSVFDVLWRTVFAGWSFSILALILASIIRVQVGAMAAIFLIPGTVEPLLGLLLKEHQVYLPFSAVAAVTSHNPLLSYTHAALTAVVYVVVGWVIAAFLLMKRDAN